MLSVLSNLIFLAIGFIIGYYIYKVKAKQRNLIWQTKLEHQEEILQTQIKSLEKEKEQLRIDFQIQIDTTKAENKENFERYKKDFQNQALERKLALENEFKTLATSILEEKQKSLTETNKTSFSAILTPLQERLSALNKTVVEVNIAGAKDKASLEEIIKNLMQRTEEIGKEAINLTKALKGDSKIQGDWGEMILERLLEQSGLRRDEEFFIQESIEINNNKKLRPDVIVRLPKNHAIIIDSKVSLTAYANAVNASNSIEQENFLQQHLNSIHKHIEELSKKDYGRFIEGADKFVLMFIPNESSYIAAVQKEPDLSSKAYQKNIIIVSPTSLIMTLQLAQLIWQTERQFNNVEDIINKCNALYDKMVNFSDNFIKIGENIEKAKDSYTNALGQLSLGRGNIITRFEKIKEMGLTTSKNIDSKLKKNSLEDH